MKKTISNFYLLSTLLISAFLVLGVGSVFQKAEQSFFKENIQRVKDDVLSNYKDEVKNLLDITQQQIISKKKFSENLLKEKVKEKTYEAHKIISSIYTKYKNQKSLTQIEELIKDTLRDVRFFQGRGYYFIDSMDKKCILYPIRKEIEGTNILDLPNNSQYAIHSFVDIIKEKGEGFHTYYKHKYKYEKNAALYKKISFVKLFEPLNWVIGVGEYVEDMEEDIKREIIYSINDYEVIKDNKFINIFKVHDFNGGREFATILAMPQNKDMISTKIDSNKKDAHGVEYIKEILSQLKQKDEAFIIYSDINPKTGKVSSKLSYFKKIEGWNWVISSSIYLDKLEELVEKNTINTKYLYERNRNRIFVLLGLSFFILAVISLIFSRKIKNDLKQIRLLINDAYNNHRKIDFDKIVIDDFKYIVTFFNHLILQIKSQQINLENANTKLENKVEVKTKELSETNKFLEEKNALLEKTFVMDALTGLGNRNMLTRDLQSIKRPTLIIIDIDGFRSINDFYGIKTGDILLFSIGSFISDFAKEKGAKAYRLGSDEFLLVSKKSKEEIQDCVEDFIKEIASYSFFDHTETVTFSISVTCGISANENSGFLSKADTALRYAKLKNLPFAIFDKNNPQMNKHKQNIQWRERIQRAINNDSIIPYFQPIVNVNDANLSKYEVLMRLKDGDEIFTPFLFLDIAKKTKQYHFLTKIMIEKTFKTFANSSSIFSMNIDIQDVEDEETVLFLQEKIQEYKVGDRLILEILENEDILNSEKFLDFVKLMRSYGVSFSLDDFGSGYSNFSFLSTMQPKFLKIDGSLIKNINDDVNSFNIVKTIVNFAKDFNAIIIAEFVENEEIVKTLKSLGVSWMQGYHFAAPKAKIKN